MKTTGKYSVKPYKCNRCGLVQDHGTNHWGEIYPYCKGCSWKHPLSFGVVMTCLEKMPKGYKKPEKWKTVKLEDICEISDIKQ